MHLGQVAGFHYVGLVVEEDSAPLQEAAEADSGVDAEVQAEDTIRIDHGPGLLPAPDPDPEPGRILRVVVVAARAAAEAEVHTGAAVEEVVPEPEPEVEAALENTVRHLDMVPQEEVVDMVDVAVAVHLLGTAVGEIIDAARAMTATLLGAIAEAVAHHPGDAPDMVTVAVAGGVGALAGLGARRLEDPGVIVVGVVEVVDSVGDGKSLMRC